MPELLADDITPEKIPLILAEQGGRLAIASPEGDLFELVSRYTKTGGANIDVLLKAYTGEDLRVDRIGRPPVHVSQPALTSALAVQPHVLESLSANRAFRGKGLLARFTYVILENKLGRRAVDSPPLAPSIRFEYRDAVRGLLTYVPKAHPEILRLSAPAAEIFQAFRAELEPELLETGLLGAIPDSGSKLFGTVARLAGILHLAETPGRGSAGPVSARTMEGAIQLGRYLLPHALAAFHAMAADPNLVNARHILSWIHRVQVPRFNREEVVRFPERDALWGVRRIPTMADLTARPQCP